MTILFKKGYLSRRLSHRPKQRNLGHVGSLENARLSHEELLFSAQEGGGKVLMTMIW